MSNSSKDGGKKTRRYRPMKNIPPQKEKLEPETVFIETAPSKYELIVPAISVLTVIGIIPFTAALARFAWVRYKVTSRRISIASGFQGRDQTEIIYRDIERIKYVRRIGNAGDCVITLKDGAKLEIRAIPQFEKIYDYIMEKVDESVREASGPA